MAGLYENFSSLPVGSRLTPPGWNNPFGSTLILAGLVPENFNSHICQCQNGNLNQNGTFFPLANATLTWWFSISRNSLLDVTVGSLLTTTVASGQAVPLISVVTEADASLSIYANNIFIGNSGINGIYILQEGFYWAQFNVALSVDPATKEIAFTQVQLGINGVKVIDKTLIHSGIFTTQVEASITGLEFAPPVQGALLLSEIDLSGLTTIPYYPNPGTNYHGRVSQGVIEIVARDEEYSARVSQGVVEVGALPKIANARISQAVIEIMTNNYTPTPPSGQGGWTVREV